MREVTSSLPQYIFTAWCLLKPAEVKVLPLLLTKHCAMKAYWEVEV